MSAPAVSPAPPTRHRPRPSGSWLAWCGCLFILCAAFLLGPRPTPAHAYAFFLSDSGDAPLRWFSREDLTIRLGSTGHQFHDGEALYATFERLLDLWTAPDCSAAPPMRAAGWVERGSATTPTHLDAPPDNVVVFVEDPETWGALGHAATWVAVTKISHHTRSGEILDADIEVNTGHYALGLGAPAPGLFSFSVILGHELGHAYGLDHSTLPDVLMFYAYHEGGRGGEATLSEDDIAGICALYADVPVHGDPGCASGALGLSFGWLGLLYAVLVRGRRRRLRS